MGVDIVDGFSKVRQYYVTFEYIRTVDFDPQGWSHYSLNLVQAIMFAIVYVYLIANISVSVIFTSILSKLGVAWQTVIQLV